MSDQPGASVPDPAPNPNGDSIEGSNPPVPPIYKKATLVDLIGTNFPKNDWIIKDLICSGDQVVLAGPPKIGKSILGTQLALAVAEGKDHFLSKEYVPEGGPKKVLIFSFEMNKPMVAERLKTIFPPVTDPSGTILAIPIAANIPLLFVFGAGGTGTLLDEGSRSSFDVVDFDRNEETKAKKAGTAYLSSDGSLLQKIVRLETPDLVIFDTLIRVHALDENNNVAMSHLLRYLRDICSIDEQVPAKDANSQSTERHRKKIAHVLIHHTRKESNIANSSANRDANAVRGAGAIHAEADLVLTLSEWDRDDTVMMSTSARRVSPPDEIFLKRNGLKFHAVEKPLGTRQTKALKLAEALWETFQEILPPEAGRTRKQIVQRVAELGYGDLTEDNFRKTYFRKIAPWVLTHEPKKGEDPNYRYKLKADADQSKFFAALKTKSAPR